jgi:hypothetical protein
MQTRGKPFSLIDSKNSSLPPKQTFFQNYARGRAPKHKTDSTPLSTVIIKITVLFPVSREIFVNFCACPGTPPNGLSGSLTIEGGIDINYILITILGCIHAGTKSI